MPHVHTEGSGALRHMYGCVDCSGGGTRSIHCRDAPGTTFHAIAARARAGAAITDTARSDTISSGNAIDAADYTIADHSLAGALMRRVGGSRLDELS